MGTEAYLRHAAQAEAWARQSAHAREQEAYMEIAALWRALALRQAETTAAAPPPQASQRDR